ncbi:MAG: hypothetical protein N3A69_12380 [Leptospiraceae bacterium]|nr:hypothetical protein [Leptospiraceae bacterium]
MKVGIKYQNDFLFSFLKLKICFWRYSLHILYFTKEKLSKVFNPEQAGVLADRITGSYTNLVQARDFNEFKGIEKDLAISQKELVEAQKQSEKKLAQLSDKVERSKKILQNSCGNWLI